jgi:hypothetical protein
MCTCEWVWIAVITLGRGAWTGWYVHFLIWVREEEQEERRSKRSEEEAGGASEAFY